MATESPFSPLCNDSYKDILMKRLEQNKALVISTTVCPACVRAKNLLDRNSVAYKEIHLDMLTQEDAEEVGRQRRTCTA